jgi:2-polyprenyl-3-methyl-5-hydroxy-6-metoxy-1,4-benzoquinol methylase
VVLKSLQVPEIQQIILVVPDCQQNHQLFGDIASRYGINVFYGNVENRLQRFLDCAAEFNTDVIVRLPCCKPLFRADLVSLMVAAITKSTGIDLVTVPPDFPRFFSCEVMKTSVLAELATDRLSERWAELLRLNPFLVAEKILSIDKIFLLKDELPRLSDLEITLARDLRRRELEQGGAVLADSEKLVEQSRYEFAAKFVRETDHVLDIACGAGTGCEILAGAARHGRVLGIDLEKNANFKTMESHIPNVNFLVGDVMEMKLHNVFDRIVSLETIEHLEQPKKFLGQLRDILADDGLMVISVPKKMSEAYLDRPLNPYHVHEYSASELLELIDYCGFVAVERFMQDELGRIEEGWPLNASGSLMAVCRKSLI